MRTTLRMKTVSMLLVAGTVSMAIAGSALAAEASSDRVNGQQTTTRDTDQPSDGVMNSRMAPSQTTTATGRNPDANSVDPNRDRMTDDQQRSNTDEMSTDDRSSDNDSTLPRMAPTQSTQGTGEQSEAGS